MEEQLILRFHLARRKQLANSIIAEMAKLRAGGLFDGWVNCRSLWDEACWALQESNDEQAVDAAASAIWQFGSGRVTELLPEELRLHCYLVADSSDDDGLPCADEDAVRKDLEEAVRELACWRDISSLEMR